MPGYRQISEKDVAKRGLMDLMSEAIHNGWYSQQEAIQCSLNDLENRGSCDISGKWDNPNPERKFRW